MTFLINLFKKINKYAPEYFTIRIYQKIFTPVRVIIFWLLFFFYIIDALWFKIDATKWFPFWNSEVFTSVTTKMIYLLISIGAFATAFYAIEIDIIKRKNKS